ncbi:MULTISPECIES: DUF4190 domain-containing protein [unclassified Paenibacillus]|uniref:DUF4190 domain-containing protein n=1 Tax=unclassified Paenibacillus TaxID=185978 RepID=UPI0030FCCBDF
MNYQPPPYGEQDHFGQYPKPPLERMNSKAVAALVLGILSIVIPYVGIIFGITAIILATLAFREIRYSYEQGRGLAIAGLVCGIASTFIYTILIIMFVLTILLFNHAYTAAAYNLIIADSLLV